MQLYPRLQKQIFLFFMSLSAASYKVHYYFDMLYTGLLAIQDCFLLYYLRISIYIYLIPEGNNEFVAHYDAYVQFRNGR